MADASPPAILRMTISPEWIDHNRHLNVAAFIQIFHKAMEIFLDRLDVGFPYTATGRGSMFMADTRFRFESEVLCDETVTVTAQLLDVDSKRLHIFLRMWNVDRARTAATSEILAIHVSGETRRSAPFPSHAAAGIEALFEEHRRLPWPPEVGRPLGITKKRVLQDVRS